MAIPLAGEPKIIKFVASFPSLAIPYISCKKKMITYGMSMQSFLLTHFRPGNFEQDSQLGRVSPNGLLPETHF